MSRSDRAMKWYLDLGKKGAYPIFIVLFVVTFTLMYFNLLLVVLFLYLAFAVGVCFLFARDTRDALVGWTNSIELDKISTTMLFELLHEMAITDPARATNLARQFSTMREKCQIEDFEELVERDEFRKESNERS